jgi:flavodoxin
VSSIQFSVKGSEVMRVLVLYDTVSESKMTKQVAESITETLKENGIDVDSFYVKDIDAAKVKEYGCLIAGAPTMAFRATVGIMNFLNALGESEFAGIKAATFDTQIKAAITGNAAKGIEKKLEKLGFTIFKEPLVVYVERKDKNLWQFKAGQVEKTKAWAQELAKKLSE